LIVPQSQELTPKEILICNYLIFQIYLRSAAAKASMNYELMQKNLEVAVLDIHARDNGNSLK
jgi:hypothetical protein